MPVKPINDWNKNNYGFFFSVFTYFSFLEFNFLILYISFFFSTLSFRNCIVPTFFLVLFPSQFHYLYQFISLFSASSHYFYILLLSVFSSLDNFFLSLPFFLHPKPILSFSFSLTLPLSLTIPLFPLLFLSFSFLLFLSFSVSSYSFLSALTLPLFHFLNSPLFLSLSNYSSFSQTIPFCLSLSLTLPLLLFRSFLIFSLQ